MLMSDKWIIEHSEKHNMISPFCKSLVSFNNVNNEKSGIISYGLSSYGYDVRIDNKFKVFKNQNLHQNGSNLIIDPKNFNHNCVEDIETDCLILPPNSFTLACTVETIHVPEDVLVLCIGKSTYARCGIVVNTTPLEPGWKGQITIEISNTTQIDCKIYANEGIAQLLFFKGNEKCLVSYSNRSGKYMNQLNITTPKIISS